MIVRFKPGLVIVTAETESEKQLLGSHAMSNDGHLFVLRRQDDRTLKMLHCGLREDVCREPLNVTSRASDPAIRLISNLAFTPFELHDRQYASVEGFWQGLKFDEESAREQIAQLSGMNARRTRNEAKPAESFVYNGRRYRTGTYEHWQLMEQACWAKFSQHEEARAALLSTGERPLSHRVRHDSRTIPGVIMADIWMSLRSRLRSASQTD